MWLTKLMNSSAADFLSLLAGPGAQGQSPHGSEVRLRSVKEEMLQVRFPAPDADLPQERSDPIGASSTRRASPEDRNSTVSRYCALSHRPLLTWIPCRGQSPKGSASGSSRERSPLRAKSGNNLNRATKVKSGNTRPRTEAAGFERGAATRPQGIAPLLFSASGIRQ